MGATNFPIPVIVDIAYASAVFAFSDIEKYRAYRGGVNKTPDIYVPYKLVLEGQLLEWRNNHFPDDFDLSNQGNYVLGLCGQYLGAALRALGGAGGVIINPTTGNPINMEFYRADFIIGTAGSLMADGDTTLTIHLSNFVNKSVHFLYSGSDGSLGIDTGGARVVSIVYNPAYVIITLNQPVRNGEIYEVWGVRALAGTVSGGGSGLPVPLPLQKGKFLTNDGANLIWDDTWIRITSASEGWQPDGRTYIDATLDGYYLKVYWENTQVDFNFESDPPEAVLIDGGGFIIEQDGFDVFQNPAWIFYIHKKSLL